MNALEILKPQLIKKAVIGAKKELGEEVEKILIFSDVKGKTSQVKLFGATKRKEYFKDTGEENTKMFLRLITTKLGAERIKEFFFVDTKILPAKDEISFTLSYINGSGEKIKTTLTL